MENKDSERVACRKLVLKAGDYVFIRPVGCRSNEIIYKIASIESVEHNTQYMYTVNSIGNRYSGNYLCEKKYFKKATNFEIIVAKLKGKLYE